jgi:phosphonatase-like hydrolase
VTELVCVDMAGTTVDDGDAVMASFRSAMTAVGLAGDEIASALSYAAATMGSSKIEVFRAIVGDEARAVLANTAFESAYDDVVARGAIAPIPGAIELFERCRAAGIRTCLTTGFAPATRDAIVDRLGWARLVDLVLSPADAGRGRPFPDMILTAIVRLGVTGVAEVAVAGDTTNDLVAGTRAGAGIVAGVLTGAHTAEQLAAAPHTHLIESVADLWPLVQRSVPQP